MFPKHSLHLLLILSPVALALNVQGDEDLLDLDIDELMNVKVSSASKISENQSSAAATIYVITEEQIQRYGYQTLQEAIQNIPSVTPINLEFFAFGGQRGSVGNFSQTHLLIDGREVQNLIAAETFISHQFATHNVKQIEVINGPSSVLYGANAFVGVINIITKHRDPEFKGHELIFDYGSENRKSISWLGSHHFKDLRMSASIRRFTSDGWDFQTFVKDSENFAEGYPSLATQNNHLDSDPYNSLTTATPWSLDVLYKQVYIGAEGWQLTNGKGLENVALDYNSQRDHRHFYMAYAGFNTELNAHWDVKTEYQYSNEMFWGRNFIFDTDTFDDLVAAGRPVDQDFNQAEILLYFDDIYSQKNSSGSQRHKFELQSFYSKNEISIVSGISVDRLDILGIAFSNDGTTPAFNETRSNSNRLRRPFFLTTKQSVYSQWTQKLTRRFSLVLGGRLDNHSTYGTITTFRGGGVYQPRPNHALKLLYGEGFREPNIFEFGAQAPTFEFNLDLEPAKNKTLEVSWQQPFMVRGKTNIVAYYSEISRSILPASTYAFINSTDNQEFTGIEWAAQFNFETMVADSGLTLSRSPNRTLPLGKIENANNYPVRFFLGVSSDIIENWTISGRTQYYSKVNAEHGNPDIQQKLTIEDAWTFEFNIINRTKLFSFPFVTSLKVTNALDKQFYQPNSRNGGPKQFLQPGTQWLLNIKLQLPH